MLKKIISLSLALCMILSLAAIVPVWAGESKLTETFEASDGGSVKTKNGMHYTSTNVALLTQPDKNTSNTLAGSVTLDASEGYNSSTGLMLKPGTVYKYTSTDGQTVKYYFRDNSLVTKSYELKDDNEVILEFKIKFNKISENSAVYNTAGRDRVWAYIGVVDINTSYPSYEHRLATDYNPVSMRIGANTTTPAQDARKFNLTSDPVTLGAWYTVVTTAKKGEPASTIIYDAGGNTVISASATADLGTTVKFRPVYTPAVTLMDDTTVTDEYEIVVDDISVTDRTLSAAGTAITVNGNPYTVTKPDGDSLVATGCTLSGTVTSLSMTIDGATVKVAGNAWDVDSNNVLRISNSLITAGAAFTTSTAAADATEVSVQTLKVGKNDNQSSLYMLGKITGVPAKYGVRLACSTSGLSGDYDAAGTNALGEFLVELGYGSKLPTGKYSLTAYADSATGKTGTVTIE